MKVIAFLFVIYFCRCKYLLVETDQEKADNLPQNRHGDHGDHGEDGGHDGGHVHGVDMSNKNKASVCKGPLAGILCRTRDHDHIHMEMEDQAGSDYVDFNYALDNNTDPASVGEMYYDTFPVQAK